MHRHIASGQWAVQLLQCSDTLPGGNGQCNSCNVVPHCMGEVGSGTLAMRGPTSWGDGDSYLGGGRCLKTEFVQCTATLSGGSGQCNSCNALPHCLGAVGSGTLAMRRTTNWGDGESCLAGDHCLKTEFVQCTATLSWSSGQCNSRSAVPHCLGAVGSATLAMRGPISWGDGESCLGGGRCLKSARGG